MSKNKDKKQVIVQNVKLIERVYSVRWYNDAQILINLLQNHIQRNSENELGEVMTYAEDFRKLTDGISFEDFSESMSDEKEIERINKVILKNIKKNPNGLIVLNALQKCQSKMNIAKDTFVTGNSMILNEYGIETMTSNLRLIFKTQYDGDFDKINFETEDIDEVCELIDKGKEGLEDFFVRGVTLKNRFQISPITFLTMKSTANRIYQT